MSLRSLVMIFLKKGMNRKKSDDFYNGFRN